MPDDQTEPADTDLLPISQPELAEVSPPVFPGISVRLPQRKSPLRLAGYILLTFWICIWTLSFAGNQFALGDATWIPTWDFLGLDFMHNFLGLHAVAEGVNPYRQSFGDFRGLYTYPPLVLVEFSWCVVFARDSFMSAAFFWIAVSAVMFVYATWIANTVRYRLDGSKLSFSWAAGVVLMSTPVLFEMERGNCNVVVLLCLALAARCMRSRRIFPEMMAGALLAIAIWTKIFPGFLFVALLILQRYRVAVCVVGGCLLILLSSINGTRQWVGNMTRFEDERMRFISVPVATSLTRPAAKGEDEYASIDVDTHSLTSYWRLFWSKRGMLGISRVNGLLGTLILILPLVFWVGWPIWKAPDATHLTYPALLWTVLLATFCMPMSYDYNLIFFPIMVIAVYRLRDGIPAGFLLLLSVAYFQPLRLHLNRLFTAMPQMRGHVSVPELLLFVKVGGLVAMSISLRNRSKELTAASPRITLS